MMRSLKLAALAAAVVIAVLVAGSGGAAIAEEGHTLTVKSVPVSGIAITTLSSKANGTTEYSIVCSGSVRLYAPKTVAVSGDDYQFVRWEVDGTPGTSTSSAYMVMDQDHVAVAVYTERVATLTVKSLPISDVEIGGDVPGTTNYTASCDYAQPVTLVAPASVTTDKGEHPFVQWIVNGIEQPDGQATIEAAMDCTCTAIAIFREPQPVLEIGASPWYLEVPIGGDKPGITDYSVTCVGGDKIRFIAPAEAVDGNVRYTFDRWSTTGFSSSYDAEIEITVNFSCVATARYKEVPSVLTIRSEPITGISISCPKPSAGVAPLPSAITTEYTTSLSRYKDITLIAPATAQRDGETFDFQRWTLNGIAKPDAKTGLAFRMNGDKTAVAVYAKTGILHVLSSPPGIGFDGFWPGTTPYSITASTTVDLVAPSSQLLDGALCTFIRWEIDGLPQPELQRPITVTIPPDHSVKAIYEITQPQLHVSSTPIPGILISGDKPGITTYSASCSLGESVSLQAPETVTVGGVQYRFVRWTMGSQTINGGEPAVHIDRISNNVELTVCYTDQPPTLTVSSSPCSVWIGGTRPGATGYTVTGEYLEEVTLQAPANAICSDQLLVFNRWIVDGRDMPKGLAATRITLRGEHTAIAIYGAGALLRFVGPADRGEPALSPGGGTFTVDIFLANAGMFAGFQTLLQFIDASGDDTAFLIQQEAEGNPVFDNLHIAFNDARWPSIFPIFPGSNVPAESQRRFLGFLSMQPDTTVIDETWLCTITYEYGPSAEGTYSITADDSRDCSKITETRADALPPPPTSRRRSE